MTAWAMFAAGLPAGLAATFLCRAAAWRVGLVDRPDGRRKTQAQPVALAGGLGVLLGTLLALAGAAGLVPEVRADLLADGPRAAALAAAAVVIALVGLGDDAVNLRARHKLVGQGAAILILIAGGGYQINEVAVFGWIVPLGPLAAPVTAFWFLAAVNAINLLDGMDGLLGTVGLLICGTLAAMAFAAGQPFAGWVAAALAGSLLGFLRFNWPPASVYLGDCGSMLIGLVVGALAITATLKGPAVAIMAPACLLVLPLMDTTAAVVRRKLTGRGLAIADRGHLHHVLQKLPGMTRPRVLLLVTALGLVAGGGALVSTAQNNDAFALVAAAVVVLILVAGGLFGTAEARLVRERTRAVVRAAVGRGQPVEMEVRLQGSGDWAGVWARLVQACDQLDLLQVRLDVNAPAWHEQYHGRWDRRAVPAPSELDVWRLELPVFGHGQVIGRLSVAGVREAAPVADLLARLSGVLAEAEHAAGGELPPRHAPTPTPHPPRPRPALRATA